MSGASSETQILGLIESQPDESVPAIERLIDLSADQVVALAKRVQIPKSLKLSETQQHALRQVFSNPPKLNPHTAHRCTLSWESSALDARTEESLRAKGLCADVGEALKRYPEDATFAVRQKMKIQSWSALTANGEQIAAGLSFHKRGEKDFRKMWARLQKRAERIRELRAGWEKVVSEETTMLGEISERLSELPREARERIEDALAQRAESSFQTHHRPSMSVAYIRIADLAAILGVEAPEAEIEGEIPFRGLR